MLFHVFECVCVLHASTDTDLEKKNISGGAGERRGDKRSRGGMERKRSETGRGRQGGGKALKDANVVSSCFQFCVSHR